MPNNDKITKMLAAAREQLGVRWRHQGRAPGVALDCVGLIDHAAQASGVTIPHSVDYARRPTQAELLGRLARVARRARGIPLPGQIAVLRYGGAAQHVALVVQGGRIIHSYAPSRAVVETYLPFERLHSLWWLRGLD